jgi:ectoine hydroxylase-related dioxygenase (phytanoyl-CoA dioxygenase family)
VIKGSHVHFDAFFQEHPGLRRQKDYIQPTNQVELIRWFSQKGCEVERIPLLAGQLLLWDSRTFHCGAKSASLARAPRMCVYVCMQPRQLLDSRKEIARVCARKRAIWGQGRMTSHWPLRNRLFGKFPQLFGRAAPAIKPPPPYGPEDMSVVERSMYGF